jgi:hypothetical protein
MNKRHVIAAEHLKDYITHVLEAFMPGRGTNFGADEPITLDVALRLIWAEVQRMIMQLDDGSEPATASYFRVDAPDMEILTMALERQGVTWATARFRAARKEGDRVVAYLTTLMNLDPILVAKIAAQLQAVGCNVRECSAGAYVR